jgi:sulfite reductase (NADPH) flavoprotein alpha-component
MSKITGKLTSRIYLTPSNSEKKTLHLEIAFDEPNHFEPGDSIALDVVNPADAVDEWIKKFNKDPNEAALHKKTQEMIPLIDLLTQHVNLQSVAGGDLETARPLMPRFYSIASSQNVHGNSIHLLVTLDEFLDSEGQMRMGVASHFLSQHLQVNDVVSFKIFPNHNFRLPEDHLPIIMIGSGTGLAPYKAFLEERLHRNSTGKNWLIFGERSASTHFYYRDFFQNLVNKEKLILSCAFSRDQQEKIYVQHRLKENIDQFFELIDLGAIIYICGDAKVMAKDVVQTIEEMYQKRFGISQEEAQSLVKELKRNKKLILDVY